MVVYTTDEGGYLEVARAIADDRGERLSTELPTETDEPVLYVDSPSNVNEGTLLKLQQRLEAKGPDRGAFGVVTGYTPESAAELYRDPSARNDEHAILVQIPYKSFSSDDFEDDADATALVGDEASVENLRELGGRDLASLAIQTHGWPIHLNLPDGYVCGVPETVSVEDYDEPHPHCISDGEVNCPFDEDVISAQSLSASHVFVVSCSSMIANGMSGLPVHVGMGLLDGADSLIGSYRAGASLPHEPILHYCLLRAGYALSERCYLLNRNSHANGVMAHPYVPFGRPDAGVESSDRRELDYSLRRDSDGVALDVSPAGNYVVDVSVPAETFEGDPERLYVRNAAPEERETPLYYVAFEEGDELRILVFTGAQMDDELQLQLDETPTGHDRKRTYAASLENAQENKNLGILSGKAKNQLDDLWYQLHNLPEEIASERYDADAHRWIRGEVAELSSGVEAIRDELTETALEGEYFQNYYRSRAVDDEVFVADGDCFQCGRDVFIKQISDGYSTYRAIGHCPRCGQIYDVPTTDGERDPPHPTVRGDLLRSDRRMREIEIEFENPESYPMDAVFAPTLRHDGNATADGESYFEPATVQKTIPAGASATASFVLDTELVADNQHYLFGRVVGNDAVYSGNTVLLVGEQTGFLQPWHRD